MFRTDFFSISLMKIRAWHAVGFGILIFPILVVAMGIAGAVGIPQLGYGGFNANINNGLPFVGMFSGPLLGLASAIIITLDAEGNGALARATSFLSGCAAFAIFFFFTGIPYRMVDLFWMLSWLLLPMCWSVLLIFLAIFSRGWNWVR